ncbi:hypothetical protein A3B84_02545 [Candidatus Nomurabacteria bacterium RIFCSPHIGHO2_02_FULL_35_13]|uniref:Uncharacterized protein n=1 Tax=Candidatus Nomurabacteria bacterium RIFCSPHIGHO2_02_FULL_35_13 TaxID=1801748 RepID=A0A1F6VNC1_9BACT|nr:MAG: hypothetical protein A3B84_02545 [Candidatus Nomurabacteria bacterium RIFCSPHIGHO2_02_FULL_35_13]
METATFVVVLVSLLVVVRLVFRSSENEVLLRNAINVLKNMSDVTEAVVEGKRLSTILVVEAKKDISISAEEFEPKKEELKKNMLEALDKGVEMYRNKRSGRIADAGTVAYVTLDHSGFDQFVTSNVRSKAKDALARLIANQDVSGAKRFIAMLARNL